MPSVSADSTETLVMFARLMMAFIYHGNAHEAVTGALQTWEVSLTYVHVVHHWTGMSWHNGNEWACHNGMIHVALKWWMCVRQFGHITSLDNQREKHGFGRRPLKRPFHLSFNGKSRPSSGFRTGQEKTCPSKPISAFLHSSFTGPSHFEEMHSPCMTEQQLPIKMSGGLMDNPLSHWWQMERCERGTLGSCQGLCKQGVAIALLWRQGRGRSGLWSKLMDGPHQRLK